MVWVFGNSCERVPIKDLNDVIYFRQKKQYSDQEFEGSRDLQREIQKGRVIKLEHHPEVRSSLPEDLRVSVSQPRPTVDIAEIRRVITEVVSERKPEGVNLKDLAVNLIPVIAETVRQEVSKIQVSIDSGSALKTDLKFQDPNYVPEVKTDGLKSNISIEGKQVEGQDVVNSLELLKRFNVSK
jgi:hypothetical protein